MSQDRFTTEDLDMYERISKAKSKISSYWSGDVLGEFLGSPGMKSDNDAGASPSAAAPSSWFLAPRSISSFAPFFAPSVSLTGCPFVSSFASSTYPYVSSLAPSVSPFNVFFDPANVAR